MLDSEERIPLDDIPKHPWIVKHCSQTDGFTARKKSS